MKDYEPIKPRKRARLAQLNKHNRRMRRIAKKSELLIASQKHSHGN